VESIFDTPPPAVREDLAGLRASLGRSIPSKTPSNILIATWNIRKFGGLTRRWLPTGRHSPMRDLRALISIIEIISRFDVVAVQEVTGNLRALRDTMKFLGSEWSFLMTDVTLGSAGNRERLAYIFHNRRVQASGLAGEVVIPPEWTSGKDPRAVLQRQFARTPYSVSFRAGPETFILLTAHIEYGGSAEERIPELRGIARWVSDWAGRTNRYHQNFLVLGDFNIDRKESPLWKAFMSTGLHVPEDLQKARRSVFTRPGGDPRLDKFYDQIAWFTPGSGKAGPGMEYVRGGDFDFLPHVYAGAGLSRLSISHRVSDHFPLWAEFRKRTG